MMKKIILFCFVLALTFSSLRADDEYYYHKLDYDDFVSWVKNIKIPGFAFSQTEREGSEEVYNIEYKAIFLKDNDFIQVRIGHPDVFYQYEDQKAFKLVGPYDLEGFPTVFMYNEMITKPQNATYMLSHVPGIEATFSITALTKNRLTQEEMETVFRSFSLNKLGVRDASSWPKEIPVAIRIPGIIKSIEKLDDNDNSMKAVYSVKFAKSNEFVLELKKFYKEMRGWLDIQTFKDNTLVCKTTTDMKRIEKMQDGEILEFIYYIK
jgi:hypothetical protein